MAAETIIQLRRGSAAAWSSQNPTLSAGEFGLETDTFKMKMGDGSTSWESLNYVVKQVDNLNLNGNTLSSVDENGDIVLDPNGEGVVDVSSARITNVGAPSGANDAATKAYVDATKQGLDVKNSVKAATTGNITLSGTQTVDGVSLIAEDRVLVKNQTVASENGIYVVKAGSWVRSADADESAEVTPGMFTFVEEGTVSADAGFVLTTNGEITLETTALAFTQFSGAGQVVAGDGMTKTGNTLDVVGTADRIVVNADSVDIASAYVGQTSITTLGTVSTGVWQGSEVGVAYGGTGATNAADARTNLGLVIGTDVQAYDADTAKYDDATANFTGSLQKGGSDVVVASDIGSTVQAYDADTAKYDDATANFSGSLQMGGSEVVVDTDIGSTVQAYSSTLDAVAGGTYVGATSITTLGTVSTGVWQGSEVGVAYGGTGATNAADARTNLGLVIGTDVQAHSVVLDDLAAGTYVGATSITTLGTVTTGVWQGTAIDNAYLANSDVSFGGVTVSLGSSDATPAFDLSDATAYPGDSSLVTVGTVTTGTWNASVVDEVYGGTGLSSYTSGDIIYASAADTLGKLAKGSAKYFLKMDANGDFPEWSNSLDGGTP